jgi:hypothetical protein
MNETTSQTRFTLTPTPHQEIREGGGKIGSNTHLG